MADNTKILGRVSLMPRGTYDPDTQYQRLDLVQYQGSGYIVLRDVQGVEPAGGDDYMLLAAKGEPGEAGENGEQGGSGGSAGTLPEGLYAVRAVSDVPASGAVSGGGLVFGGVTATVSAHPKAGRNFNGWLENGEKVCEELSYSFVAQRNRTLHAVFDAFSLQWTESALPSSANWGSVAYGGGVFVAVAGESGGSRSDKAAYSTDGGKTWTAATMPSSAYWECAAYGGGSFVAIEFPYSGSSSSDKTKAAYSTDGGQTWTASKLPSSGRWESEA